MSLLIEHPTRVLPFTGKGDVGKTSTASATAIGLAGAGKRVLLVSTDPASNMVLVARSDQASLKEAERTRAELSELGVANLMLVLNGVFRAVDKGDALARALERRGVDALAAIPAGLAELRRFEVQLLPFGLVGIEALRQLGLQASEAPYMQALSRHTSRLALEVWHGGIGAS